MNSSVETLFFTAPSRWFKHLELLYSTFEMAIEHQFEDASTTLDVLSHMKKLSRLV